MSVIVKGMEMPGGCAKCRLNRDTICTVIDACIFDETNGYTRMPNCPLRPMPEEHGALIDRELLMERFVPKQAYFAEAIREKAASAPVIVEAD